MLTQFRKHAVAGVCCLLMMLLFPGVILSQPQFRYYRLAEPVGGASRAYAVAATESSIAICGEAKEDSLYRATFWSSYGSPPEMNWENFGLPTPVSTVSSRATCCSVTDTTQILIGGSWDGGAEGQTKPIVWTLDPAEMPEPPVGSWLLPTLTGAGGSGEVRSCGFTVLDDLYASVCAGWSRSAANVPKAVVWQLESQASSWTVVTLPNYAADLGSQANSIEDPCNCEIIQDPCPCEIVVVVGWAEAVKGTVYPQLWSSTDGLQWSRTALPLPPLAVAGSANSLLGYDVRGIYNVAGSVTMPNGDHRAVLWTSEDSMQTWTVENLGALAGYANSASFDVCSVGVPDPSRSPGVYIGESYNTQSDKVATMWVKNLVVQKYDLNDVITGAQPDLVLRAAVGGYRIVRDDLELVYIVGAGQVPAPGSASSAALDDPHAWLLTNDLVLTGVEDGTPEYHPVRVSAFPNPSAGETRIFYTLGRSEPVQVCIYDVAGRRIATLVRGFQTSGDHDVTWIGRRADGSALPTGIYFVRLETSRQVVTRKVVFLK
jgi:hypothetical protein